MSNAALFAADDEMPALTFGTPMSEEDRIVQRNESILAGGTKPRPWSHTALDGFLTCPKQFHEVKVLKRVPDPPGEAAMWGDYVHVAFEHHLRDGVPLPPELAVYQPYMDRIKAKPGTMYVEHEMALDTKLNPVPMFGEDGRKVFVRGIVDVLHVYTDPSTVHSNGRRDRP
jgi:hypothetical protein